MKKNFKKLSLLVLVILTLFATMAISVSAEVKDTDVAKIGEKGYATLAEALAAANAIEGGATVNLLADVTIGEQLTITGNVTISGAYTITRANTYTGTLFVVKAGATLTLDGGLVIDGGNNYAFDRDAFMVDAKSRVNVPTEESAKWFTPKEGAPVATAFMITTTGGTINLNNVTVQNNYSMNSGVISAGANSTITLTGAKITHIACIRNSGVVANVSGANINVTVNDGTIIDSNHVGGNHGIFKIYSGAVLTMNGGEIKNTTGWNSNGVVVGIYWGSFYMNGGEICSNTGVNGPNNGRNAAIYGHRGHTFVMNGGTICHNSGAYGGLDAPYSNGKTEIHGGAIVNNVSFSGNKYHDINASSGLVITGGTFTQNVSNWLAPNTGLAYNEETGTYGTVTEALYKLHLIDPMTGETPFIPYIEGNDLASLVAQGKAFYANYYEMTLEILYSSKVDETVVIDYPMTIDLNGCTLTGVNNVYPVIRVQGDANVTITGGGKIINATDYVFVLGASDSSSAGKLTIKNGEFIGQTTVISVTKGQLTINGGKFECVDGPYGSDYLINCVDANYKNGEAQVSIKGGSFTGFNPTNNATEGTGTNFCADGYIVNDLGNGVYGVIAALVEVNGKYFATLEEAFAAAQNGETVELIADSYEDIVIPAEFSGALAIGTCTINSITNNSANATIVINGNVVVENANGSAITGKVINISGNGTLTAIANGNHAYGIGGDNTKSITIENVHILKVQGGHYGKIGTDTKYYKDAPEGGAGIGSGSNGAVITLTNVTIDKALGGSKAAGIGARYHTGVTVNITDCEIAYVEGGATAAAIGGSRVSSGATAAEAVNINIKNSTIIAVGGVYAAGIGSGYDTHCQANQPICTINIDGSTINATGGKYAAGIGTGYHNAGLAGEIKNSTINAASGDKVYKETYTSAQDIGFGVANLAKEGSNNDSFITYNGTKIALPRNVAQIGETKYLSLQEAINACKKGETVKLLADITYTKDDVVRAIGGATGFGKYYNPCIISIGGTAGTPNIPSSVNAVIDLNGHTLKNTADAYFFMIMDNAKVTFTDSVGGGKVITTADYPAVWVIGTETLVTIEDGYFKTASAGGVLHSTHGGDLVIEGGEFNTTATDKSLLIMLNSKDRNNSKFFISGVATVTIKGGIFHGFNPTKVGDDNGATSIEDIKFVDACPDSYVPVQNDNGSFSVYKVVATVDGVIFETWADAIAAIKKNSKIKLYADVEHGTRFMFPQNGGNIEIDLNGYNMAFHHNITIQFGTTLTITDTSGNPGTFKQTYNPNPLVINGNSTLNITNGVEFDVALQFQNIKDGVTANFQIDGRNIIGTNANILVSNGTTRITLREKYMKISLVMGNLVLAEDLITLAGQNITIGSGTSITIPENKTLTLSEGAQMVVNGTIVVNGKINLRNGATLTALNGLNVTTDVENSLVKYVDGKYIVKAAVAKIGNTYYETLADALTAAKTGETITLVDNVVVDGDLIIEKSITIKLNGKKIDADGLVSFSTGTKFEGDGMVKVPHGNLALPYSEGAVPVWTEDGYIFKHFVNQVNSTAKEDANGDKTGLNVVFRPAIEDVDNKTVLGGDSGLDFIITIYAGDTVVFRGTIADALVKQAYAGDHALSLNIKGMTIGTEYRVTLTIKSEAGSSTTMELAKFTPTAKPVDPTPTETTNN